MRRITVTVVTVKRQCGHGCHRLLHRLSVTDTDSGHGCHGYLKRWERIREPRDVEGNQHPLDCTSKRSIQKFNGGIWIPLLGWQSLSPRKIRMEMTTLRRSCGGGGLERCGSSTSKRREGWDMVPARIEDKDQSGWLADRHRSPLHRLSERRIVTSTHDT